uniref:Uncharacterized protein n=1 Tax=Fopius arisanus TaxID=64838 RepID=A0A0C9RHK5_9HYME
MSWYRKSNKINTNTIREEDWTGHFKHLLEAEEGSGEENRSEERRAEEEAQEEEEGTRHPGDEGEERGNEGVEQEEQTRELDAQIEDEEVNRAIRDMKNRKAAGEDQIRAESLKNLPKERQKGANRNSETTTENR